MRAVFGCRQLRDDGGLRGEQRLAPAISHIVVAFEHQADTADAQTQPVRLRFPDQFGDLRHSTSVSVDC